MATEQPMQDERVTNKEKSILVERAKVKEQPMLFERASVDEQSQRPEASQEVRETP
jgi:hypothetical protein